MPAPARAEPRPATAWRPSPPRLIALFERAVPHAPDVERRRMFGYPAAFANGHLFAGLHQEDFILRLDAADRERAVAELGVRAFEPMGRRMREYVVLPASLLGRPRALAAWLARALRYVRALPAKPARTSRRRNPTSRSAREDRR
jgi:TfoX/Sxy family transcriptional regulator of competence genes